MCVCIGSPIGCRIYTARVSMTESFLASVDELYNALTQKEVIILSSIKWLVFDNLCFQLVEAFTQSPAIVEPQKGGLFSLMDGQISGEFLECVRPSKIVQKWRLKSWPDGE